MSLTACQLFYGYLMLEASESRSLYVHIYILGIVVSLGFFFKHDSTEYEQFKNRSDLGQSGAENNCNEEVPHTRQIYRTGASPSDTV